MIRVQPRIAASEAARIVCFLPSFIYQLKLHFSWIFIFTLILTVCYLLECSILGVYGYRSPANDAWKTDTFVNSHKGEKVRWQKSVSFSWGKSRTRRARVDRTRQGRKQEFFYWMLQSSSLRTADVFPVDDRKYVWCSQASFQGAHGWNYFNKADHSRLSWHLSSMLVNVSWLDSCMGSSHDCSCLLEDAKVRTVR